MMHSTDMKYAGHHRIDYLCLDQESPNLPHINWIHPNTHSRIQNRSDQPVWAAIFLQRKPRCKSPPEHKFGLN